jgi:all-trans-nonaprenyl-diphosphate synthase
MFKYSNFKNILKRTNSFNFEILSFKKFFGVKISFNPDLNNNQKDINSLVSFDPDPEILKFYKNYLFDDASNTKENYIDLYSSKFNYINSKLSNSILSKLSKFMGIREYKSQREEIISIITNRIANSEEVNLKELSEYYFKESGKMIRPYLLITISKYMYECLFNEEKYFDSLIHKKYVLPYAACVEVLHNASLLHDDIIDNSDRRRNLDTAHNKFGIRNTVFGANYIISRAANLVTELEINNLNEIFSSMVFHLTYGECKQSLNKSDLENIDESFKIYMIKTYYKTASLIALGLRGIGCIYNLDLEMQRNLFNLGLHIGIVFQLVDDVFDVLYDSTKIKKPALKDLQEGIINSHILYEISDEQKLKDNQNIVLNLAKRKFKQPEDINKILDILKNGKGIIKTQNLAIDHLTECYKILDNPFFKNNKSKFELYQCFDFLIKRNY